MILIGRISAMLAAMLVLGSCAKEKVENVDNQREEYTLGTAGDSGLNGTVVFQKEQNGTRISISLTGADPHKSYPVAIYENTVAEEGNLSINLGGINGSTGKLDTLLQQLDNGVSISFTELVNFNGHIRINESGPEGVLVAQGDIGGNRLTGNSKTYAVDSSGNAAVTGTFILQERKNGNTLASLTLSGTDTIHTYPAFVHEGKAPADSAATTGKVTITLGDVDAKTGKLVKNIKQKDDNSAIPFKDLITYDGYVSVEQKDQQGGIVVAQGNIGRNAP
jgi:hypothetical protein